MAEPSDVPSETPASPFEPITPGGDTKGSGCAKVAVVGCLGLLIVMGIALVVLITQAPRIMSWVFDATMTQLETRYAPEVTPEDRARVRAAFGAAAKAVEEKRMDPVAMQKVNQKIMDLVTAPGQVSREQALQLAEDLETLAASKPPRGGGG